MTEDINKIIGENIKARRLKLGLNQTQVCERMECPVTQQMMMKYEKGNSRIAAVTVCDIAKALECSISSLYGKQDDDRDPATMKREGKLIKYFRSIPTVEAQMAVVNMAKAAANIFDGGEDEVIDDAEAAQS